MDSAAVTGTFTLAAGLGGVVLGWLGNWMQGQATSRVASRKELDGQYGRIARLVDQILVETDVVSSAAATEDKQELANNMTVSSIIPMMYEVSAAAVMMALSRDWRIVRASHALTDATRDICLLAIADPPRQVEREDALKQAMDGISMALYLSQVPWWRLRSRRRRDFELAGLLYDLHQRGSQLRALNEREAQEEARAAREGG
jgi:hypothetical protein